MKRVLSVVLIFITVLSVFGIVPFSAAAEETSATIGDSVTDIGELAVMKAAQQSVTQRTTVLPLLIWKTRRSISSATLTATAR